MKVLRETTSWDVEYRQPNHTYLIDGIKVVAYKKWNEGQPIYFKKPAFFDRRYRQFEELKYSKKEWNAKV